jgi:hypothetical protein
VLIKDMKLKKVDTVEQAVHLAAHIIAGRTGCSATDITHKVQTNGKDVDVLLADEQVAILIEIPFIDRLISGCKEYK